MKMSTSAYENDYKLYHLQ